MKKALAFLILVELILSPVPGMSQDSDNAILLPIIAKGRAMSTWEIVIPEATTNLVTNPSSELNITGYTVGAGALAQSATTAMFGVYSIEWTPGAAAFDNYYWALTLTAATTYTFSVWFQGQVGIPYRIYGYDSVAPVILGTPTEFVGDGLWNRHEVTFTTGANTAIRLYVGKNNSADVGITYADAWQCEQLAYSTTYCDGDQEGCKWTGLVHNSTSTRSALSRAGGRVRDLQDFYGFNVEAIIGAGMPPHQLNVDSYAILPGGQLNSTKINDRPFTLTGFIEGTNLQGVHDQRNALIDVINKDAVPNDQPIIIRYTGASTTKEIRARYENGLFLNVDAKMPCWEQRIALQFLATDPFWYEIGQSAGLLSTNDGDTLRYVTGRLLSTGQWDALGLANNPTAGGNVFTITFGPDGKVYIGGDFFELNAVPGRDYIARYDLATDTWETVGPASEFNNDIWDLAFDPSGDLWAVGDFTDGAGNKDYVSVYNIAANTWTARGNPTAGAAAITHVYDVTIDHIGDVWLSGQFTQFAGVALANYVAVWDLSAGAWVARGDPTNGAAAITSCREAAVDIQNRVYIVGQFTTFANVTGADYIVRWDPDATAWESVGLTGGAITIIYAVVIDQRGVVYVTGNMSGPWGSYITQYNGTAWGPVGGGFNGTGRKLRITPNNGLLAGGIFTEAGDLALADRAALFNGASWVHLDVNLPGAPVVYSVAAGNEDAVLQQNYDTWLGFSTTGAGVFAGTATLTNDGNENAYPIITFRRTGTGTAKIETVRNETLGLTLWLDYDLLEGEELVIDLTPTQKSITSTFWGVRNDATLPASNMGDFVLQPGANQITSFVDITGAATIEAFITFRDTYWSVD